MIVGTYVSSCFLGTLSRTDHVHLKGVTAVFAFPRTLSATKLAMIPFVIAVVAINPVAIITGPASEYNS